MNRFFYSPIIVFIILLGFNALTLKAETNVLQEQTVRGKVIDQDSKTPIIGANVIIVGSNPIMGASTDLDGNFRITNVPVGRITLQVTYLGYEPQMLSNLLVGSGKELVLTIEIAESVVALADITVTAQGNKQEALNEMATVSAKVFTVEETKRYAGSFNDPARMVSNFAGVAANPSGENDIVVRGNSPRGILWRLEGIDMPNPNHFANEGYSGGPINALNSAMLANSDFFSGAFAPEYGNAYSGVFDMKLRSGNNEKREYSFSAGALGFDGTVEGPFKPGYGGSYLVNYRYSSLALLDNLGLVNFYGVPKYQDVSFKFNLPTAKAGNFTLFGLGGKSSIDQKDFAENNEDYLQRQAVFTANLGVMGLIHTYQLSDNTYLRSSVSASGTQNQTDYHDRNDNAQMYLRYHDNFINNRLQASTQINTKIDARNRIKGGITYTQMAYNTFAEYDNLGYGNYTPSIDADGQAGLVQAYFNWKFRATEQLTFVTGVHYLHFLLNQNRSVEPRLGFEYNVNPQQAFTFGFGIHSKTENLAIYNVSVETTDNTYTRPNHNLGLAKAMHIVGGYKHQFSQNLHLKAEVYYQHLYNVAVENNPTSPYVLNNDNGGYPEKALIDKGEGRNYGLELTLERFYANRFYFLGTLSVYDSKFTALDNVLRNSAYNGKLTANVLAGKEFPIGQRGKNRSIAVNTKLSVMGGNYYTPVDYQASLDANTEVLDMTQYMSKRGDNVFKADLAVSYRRDRPRTTHEFKIDIQNITNNQATVFEYYDSSEKAIESLKQWSIFPNIIYTIEF
jgi:hypothetical protein